MPITRGRANVFEDLGFTAIEAEHLRVRADLMIAIRQLITDRKLTQVRAAKLLGVTQPRVSDLVRGKLSLFSIDALVEMLGHAGLHVRMQVASRPQVA